MMAQSERPERICSGLMVPWSRGPSTFGTWPQDAQPTGTASSKRPGPRGGVGACKVGRFRLGDVDGGNFSVARSNGKSLGVYTKDGASFHLSHGTHGSFGLKGRNLRCAQLGTGLF